MARPTTERDDHVLRVRLTAPTPADLRAVADAAVDLGCRPVARPTDAGWAIDVYQPVSRLTDLHDARPRDDVTVEVVADATADGLLRRSEVGHGDRFGRAGAVPLGPGTSERTGVGLDAGYLGVDEVESAVAALHAAHPDVTELVACAHPTHEGRRTHALRVGRGARGPGSPDTLLLLGGVHGREWVPPDALVALAADLLAAHAHGDGLRYGDAHVTAAQVRQVVDGLDLLVLPCDNPDGRRHSQRVEPMWRKNRRPASAGRVGVDVNRNFDFLWDHRRRFARDARVATSADPRDAVYRGPAAVSEPETRNVVRLVEEHPVRWLVDVHAAVPVVLHAWGSDTNQADHPEQTFADRAFDPVRGRPDDAAYGEYLARADADRLHGLATTVDDAVRAAGGAGYGVQQAYGLYPTSGASDDWASSRGVDAFTVECGDSMQPPWSQARGVVAEVCAGLLALAVHVST